MTTATTIASLLVRAVGVVMIVLGLLFWTGNALGLVNLHILLGVCLVLALWTLAFVGARSGVAPGLIAVAVAWGLLAPLLGLTQTQLLPGSAHWVIQVLHLLVGLAAFGIGDALAVRIRRAPDRVPVG